MTHPSDSLNEVRRKIAEWVASPEGQQSLAETQKQVAADIAALEKERRLDWKLLNTPVDI